MLIVIFTHKAVNRTQKAERRVAFCGPSSRYALPAAADEEGGQDAAQSPGTLLNWFRPKGQIALGCVEGFNNKGKVTTKRSYGFRSYEVLKIALYHALGDLPEPNATHRFC